MQNTWWRAPLLAALTVLLAGTGCSSGLFNPIDGAYAYHGYQLVFRLDQTDVVAGTPVSYTAWLVDPEDQPVQGLDWTLSSDLEPDLTVSAGQIVPHVAGAQNITASTDYHGVHYHQTLPLTVEAGDPYELDLQLSDVQMSAGGEIDWTVSVIDAYGNALDGSGALVTADDPAVTVSDHAVSSTVPGTYLLTADWEGLEDVEPFVVVPGPAVGVSLSLSTTDLELLQTASATVDEWDAYGNPANDPWTLWTDRPSAVVVSHRNVTFLQEGWYTVHVTVDGTDLTDSVGPFLIDSTGPKLTIDQPVRGAWKTYDTTTVTGNAYDQWSNPVTLDVNGSPVTTNASGDFSATVPLDFGTNVIDTTAIDFNGNVTDDTRAVLEGQFESYGTPLPDACEVRIQEGAGGIDTLEKIGEGLVTNSTLASLIPSPVAAGSSGCGNPCGWFGGDCYTCFYGYALYVQNPSISGTTLTIDPKWYHSLLMDFWAWNPHLNWKATDLYLAWIPIGDMTGSITADSVHVHIKSTPYVSNNQIQIPLDSVSAGVPNLKFNWDSSLWTILQWFGIDSWIDSAIQGYMQGAIASAVQSKVPPILHSALQGVQLNYDFGLQGRTYAFQALPDGIDVDETGITLTLQTTVGVDAWTHPGFFGLGSLYGDWSPPYWYYTSHGMNIAFSDDLLNQLLYSAWGGGLLDIEETSDQLGLPSSDLQTFLPGVSYLSVVAHPLLPPVAVPSSSNSADFEVQIGDFELKLYNGNPANNDLLIDAYVTAYAPLGLGTAGASGLTAQVGTPELHFDVVVPADNTQASADTEALLQALVPLILPRLTSAIGQIDIPTVSGFGITGLSVGTGGAEGGYLTLGGSLYQQ